MAQGSRVWYDSSRFDAQPDTGSEVDWTELRGSASRARVPRANRRILSLLLILLVIGGAGAILYFRILQSPSYIENVPAAVSNIEPLKKAVPSRSSRQPRAPRSNSRSEAGVVRTPELQLDATPAVPSHWADVSPPIHVDVLTSSGHVPLRVSSLAYRVNIATGTVVLVQSGLGAPLPTTASFPIRSEAKSLLGRIEGTVVLRVMTDGTGQVRQLQVISGPPALAAAAVDAVRQWRFAAPVGESEPARHDTIVTISFKSSL